MVARWKSLFKFIVAYLKRYFDMSRELDRKHHGIVSSWAFGPELLACGNQKAIGVGADTDNDPGDVCRWQRSYR